MTTPGAGHETVTCPKCRNCIGGDEPYCPFCGEDLWGMDRDAKDDCKKTVAASPYRVYGYDELMSDFDFSFERFTDAVKKYLAMDREGMNVVFIDGVSESVKDRLLEMWPNNIMS
jgi:hypothetical protein